jgi:hypothetical protein
MIPAIETSARARMIDDRLIFIREGLVSPCAFPVPAKITTGVSYPGRNKNSAYSISRSRTAIVEISTEHQLRVPEQGT